MPVAVTVRPPPSPSAEAAAGWNVEASSLLKELTATQQEVADLLTGQQQQQAELSDMKEACSTEVRGCDKRGWGLHKLTGDGLKPQCNHNPQM
jgi:hypothetical protein